MKKQQSIKAIQESKKIIVLKEKALSQVKGGDDFVVEDQVIF